MIMRGNVLAALMATFFGNPLTYIPIAYTSLVTGHWLLGTRMDRALLPGRHESACGIGCQFNNAFNDLWQNFKSIFTDDRMDWRGLSDFYGEVFYPYMIGGIIPGIVTATICYYLSVPVIRAYQNRRRKRLRDKLAQLNNHRDAG